MTDLTFRDWQTRAEKRKFRNRCFIDRACSDSRPREKFETINPAIGEAQTEVACGNGDDPLLAE